MIAILMSTYNGERYLREQIDSLLNQTYKGWKLYIRDDGSTDSTVSILIDYVKRYPDLIVLLSDGLGNLGPGNSFMHVLSIVSADYYMFCDQDDVWLNDKIEKTFFKLKSIEDKSNGQPVLVFSDLFIVDKSLNVVSNSLWKKCHRKPDNTLSVYRMLTYGSPSYGCTMMFNEYAKRLLYPYKNWKFHDHWTVLIVSYFGQVGYVNEPLIYYRQHENNVGGFQDSGYSILILIKRLFVTPIQYIKRQIAYIRHIKELPFEISVCTLFVLKFIKWIKIAFKIENV